MTIVIGISALALGALAGIGIGYRLPQLRRRPASTTREPVRRILLPFTGQGISRRAFEAAIRLAGAEDASIMPAFLARVPRNLPLDSPLPGQCAEGMPLLETIEQQVGAHGIAVDARVARGRTYRDALSHLLAEEQFDRVIVSATDSPRQGLTGDDLEWLLTKVPAEVMILRPAPDDQRRISANGVHGHF